MTSWPLVAMLLAAMGVLGYRLGRGSRSGPDGPRPSILPSDLEHLVDLARRAHRGLAGVLLLDDGTRAVARHPRGVSNAQLERAEAAARLALGDGRGHTLRENPCVVAVAEPGLALAVLLDGPGDPDLEDRVRVDLARLAAGIAAQRIRPRVEGRSSWGDDTWLTIHETVDSAAFALCERVRRAADRPTALVLHDELSGTLRVTSVSAGADRRLKNTSALPGSAAARAATGDAPVAATSGEQLFGHPRTDRRRGDLQGLVFPLRDGHRSVGALAVFGPPAGIRAESRAEIEQLVRAAAPRIAHLQAVHVRELRARTDELTGLPNRRGLHRAMETMVGEPAALLVLDLDHFKRLNDTYGHVAGDAALRHLAAVLRRALREDDVAARIGGEEFALWLPETDLAAAEEVAERVRAAVQGTPLRWHGQEVSMTCSIGVASLPQTTPELLNLYPTADAALYRAKQGGRNRVERARPSDPTAVATPPGHR